MDPELTQALEALEERVVARVAAQVAGALAETESSLRGEFRSALAETESSLRGEFRSALAETESSLRGEFRSALAETESSLRGEFRSALAETASSLRGEIRGALAEANRYAGVLAEDLRAGFRIAAEGFDPLNRRVGVLEEHDARTRQRVDLLENRISAVERRGKPRRPRPR